MATATVTAIHVYPVKSCRGVPLRAVDVTATGLAGDREYQVVDADGSPITQRTHPLLARVQPTITDQGLRLSADGREPLAVVRPAAADVSVRSLLGVEVRAGDAGDPAARWFSDLLGLECRLVAMTDASEHRVPLPDFDHLTSWTDAAPVLVASSESATWLADRGIEPFGVERFRPNITVTGGAPWIEDTWRSVAIGEARVGPMIAWPRCTVPQVEQRSGERHREPAIVLRRHRWCSAAPSAPRGLRGLLEGNALFGIAGPIAPVGAVVRVGDDVRVTETIEPILTPPG